MRIAKYLSNAGYCSRREAEKLITNKKVKINNLLCSHPSQKVNNKDVVKINNKTIELIDKIKIWKLHKPIKYICSNRDPENRKTIFDLIPNNFPRLISVGRLDYMSEGLLLLTNSGDYSRKLELPSSKYERVYRVCLRGKISDEDLNLINQGIIINKIYYKNIHIVKEKFKSPFTWLIIKLIEGKNREIRKISNYFSWKIVKLIRIQYGPYKLLDLKPGQIKEAKLIYND